MLDAVVLDALADAARAGEDHLARRALAKADPVVAWWLRRRVTTAIRWASSCIADPSDRGQVLRLAFLREAGALGDVAFEDRAAVAAAFDAAAAKAGPVPRVWTASIVLLGVAVATALGAGVHAWRAARFDPTSAPIGRALGPDLTDQVVRTSHARALQREAKGPAAPQTPPGDLPPMPSHLSTSLAGPLSDVFGAYRSAALGPQCVTAGCFDALTASIQRLDGALHTAREPYFVDSTSLSDGEPILMSYYVARERTANVGGSEVRLLRVQRLDQLDKTLPVLGYTSPHLGAGLVTLDTIERDLVQVVMPALAEGGVARLVDEASRDDGAPWAQDVERRAGEALRRDYASYQSPALDRVIALLALREQLYWELAAATARAGASLVRPRRLTTADSLDALEGLVAPSSLRRWRETNASLDEASAREAFDVALDRMAERVERHELEHQIDYRAGLVALPADLGTLLGVTDAVVDPGSAAARCRDELSAELASVATDPALAATMFVLSLGAVFDRGQWSTPYAYAGAVLLDAIARELGANPGEAQRIDLRRDRSAALFTAVVAKPGKDIADAASRAYARLFAVPLPAATLGPAKTYPVWRR